MTDAFIGFQNPAEMRLAQDNHMIDALAPDRSDQPFGKAILPRRAWCSGLVPDAHGTQSARDDNAVDSIPISDHIARSHLPGKSLGYLTCNPLRRRVGCDVNPNEISAIKPYNHEAVEQVQLVGYGFSPVSATEFVEVLSRDVQREVEYPVSTNQAVV